MTGRRHALATAWPDDDDHRTRRGCRHLRRPGPGAPPAAPGRHRDRPRGVRPALRALGLPPLPHRSAPAHSAAMAGRLAAVVPGHHEAVVAVLDGHPVGLGRWLRDPGEPARSRWPSRSPMPRRGAASVATSSSPSRRRPVGPGPASLAHVHGDNCSSPRGCPARCPPPERPRRTLPPVPRPPGGVRLVWLHEPVLVRVSEPSGSGTTPGAPSPGGSVHASSSRSSCRAVVERSRPRSSSNGGATTPGG